MNGQAASVTPQPQPCKYRTGKTLGHGTYSVVKEAIHIETGKHYATKVISKRLMKGREHMVKNEIVVLKRVSQGHKNILTLVDYFETPNNLYLVTDLARGNELFDRIYHKGSFYESDAANIIYSIVSGVAYLHSHGIVHRDLKPENLLFHTPDEDSDLLIADFGLSRIIDEEKFRMLTTTCGTPAYMAPEIFQKSGHGKPVDVWAIGVIAYFLLCGYTPFDRDTSAEEMQAILACDYSFEPEEYWQDVSEDARDFISKCLQIDIDKRITAEECLKHKFLSERTEREEKKQSSSSAKKTEQPNKKETDLLPTVKSNLDLRGRMSSSEGIRMSSMTMTPSTPAIAMTRANSEDKAINTMEGGFSTSPEPSKTNIASAPN